jgi:hypothetical protein
MREYHNRPDATAETVRDGWVATSDMGRLDHEGYLYLPDRKKDMFLSGGVNIYSREAETVIAELPGVRELAVIGILDELYGEAVAAYLELEPGSDLAEQQVFETTAGPGSPATRSPARCGSSTNCPGRSRRSYGVQWAYGPASRPVRSLCNFGLTRRWTSSTRARWSCSAGWEWPVSCGRSPFPPTTG